MSMYDNAVAFAKLLSMLSLRCSWIVLLVLLIYLRRRAEDLLISPPNKHTLSQDEVSQLGGWENVLAKKGRGFERLRRWE